MIMLITINLVYVFNGVYIMFMVQKMHGQTLGPMGHTCAGGLCFCRGPDASCMQKNLQYIPRVPKITTELTVTRNYLPFINSSTFHNISDLKLEKLSLTDNNLVSLASDTFKNLMFLKRLSLGKNPKMIVSELAVAFRSLNKNTIETILLQVLGWTGIIPEIFVNLYGSNLRYIYLSLNQLQNVDFEIFSGLRDLLGLYLDENALFKLKMSRIENLKLLSINKNRLSYIPNFCNTSDIIQNSYLPVLETLNLDFNGIRTLTNLSFQCLPLLNYLSMSGNPLHSIQENFISPLTSLTYLDISVNSMFTSLYDFAFNSTSLTQLIFENIDLKYEGYYPSSVFKHCPKLKWLSLRNAKLPTDTKSLYSLLSSFKHIQRLDLSFTGLTHLPHDVFSKMISLEKLDLSENKISSWDGEKVFGNSNITVLLLNGNHIIAINQTSFPISVLNSIGNKYLDLSDNLYLCTCETLESVNWFRRYANLLLYYPEEYKCFAPNNLKGTLLQNYNPSPESCAEKNIVMLVSVPVSIIAVTTMLAIFLVYKCRWRLRYGVYLFMNRHKNYEKIEDSGSFVYKGFVIYADDDRNWVHNELLHNIENKEGFRLCIRLRDFDVGKVHVDNIVDNMFLSEKIVVILSNNFAKDEWCHFQLLLAETRLLKESTDVMVIFMLEEIRSDCLRASLYKLVTDSQYVLWSNDGTGNNLFWEQAVSQIKTSTVIN